MRAIFSAVLIICMIQTVFSACSDGTFANTVDPLATTKIECTNCLPFCQTCSGATSCTKWKDGVFKGIDTTTTPSTPVEICAGSNSVTSTSGYSKADDACSRCVDGCSVCFVDYDYCLNCQAGWDWDKSGMKCVRATLGLAAVVLALSVLTLIFGVIICILSCKL